MKKFFPFLLSLVLLFPLAPAQARVYWVGRNIDMALQFGIHTKQDWRMVRSYGHSLLIVIPDNPQAFARKYNPQNPNAYFKELEKDFGHGFKGFVIAAYAANGTRLIGHADGHLVAHLNAPREMEPVRDFFAQRDNGKWNFAVGEVGSPYTDEDFALRILQRARHYIAYTRRQPLPYGTFHSITERYSQDKPNKAVNCNAFAYSLVRYAGATAVPDLYAQRVMPGIAHLLSRRLFEPPAPRTAKLTVLKKYKTVSYPSAIRRLYAQRAVKRQLKKVCLSADPAAKKLK